MVGARAFAVALLVVSRVLDFDNKYYFYAYLTPFEIRGKKTGIKAPGPVSQLSSVRSSGFVRGSLTFAPPSHLLLSIKRRAKAPGRVRIVPTAVVVGVDIAIPHTGLGRARPRTTTAHRAVVVVPVVPVRAVTAKLVGAVHGVVVWDYAAKSPVVAVLFKEEGVGAVFAPIALFVSTKY